MTSDKIRVGEFFRTRTLLVSTLGRLPERIGGSRPCRNIWLGANFQGFFLRLDGDVLPPSVAYRDEHSPGTVSMKNFCQLLK